MIALIDSDIVAYRISFACKDESLITATHTMNSYLADILTWGVDNTFTDCFVNQWKFYLTGKGNFREAIAKTAVYKGNRTAPKPAHLAGLRKHLEKEWDAVVVQGEEADDAIAIEATTLGDGNCIIVSLDKDLDQIAGWHYNFVKKIGYHIDEQTGMYLFYKQILTGDTADNIIGLKGIGPAKADRILEDITIEHDLYKACIEAYDGNEERVIENAKLLFLRRYPNQEWQPPKEKQNDNA
jgi:hypothetical protein